MLLRITISLILLLFSGVADAAEPAKIDLEARFKRLEEMPEGDRSVLDNSCLMFLSNLWSGTKHDNRRLPVVLAGGLGGTLETGRSLDYFSDGDENRKICSLYLSIMDRMGVKLEHFGDADTRLARL